MIFHNEIFSKIRNYKSNLKLNFLICRFYKPRIISGLHVWFSNNYTNNYHRTRKVPLPYTTSLSIIIVYNPSGTEMAIVSTVKLEE